MLPDARMVTSPPPVIPRQESFLLDFGADAPGNSVSSPSSSTADLLDWTEATPSATAPSQSNLLDMSFPTLPSAGAASGLEGLLSPLQMNVDTSQSAALDQPTSTAPVGFLADFDSQPFDDSSAFQSQTQQPVLQRMSSGGNHPTETAPAANSDILENLMAGFGMPAQLDPQQIPLAPTLGSDGAMGTGFSTAVSSDPGMGAMGDGGLDPLAQSSFRAVPGSIPVAKSAPSTHTTSNISFSGYSSIPNSSTAKSRPTDPANYMVSRCQSGSC